MIQMAVLGFGTVGGGVVEVTVTGAHEVSAIEIKPDVVDPDDIETLSDILVAAVNEAIKKVDATSNDEMGKITGGMGAMGGMMGMPGLF